MDTNLIIGGLVIALIAAVVAIIFISKNKPEQANTSTEVENTLNKMLPDILKRVADASKNELSSVGNEIKIDLSNKKGVIEDLVKTLTQEIKDNNTKIIESDKLTYGSFKALKQELETYQQVTDQLRVTADGLKKVLSNNQMRGQFGEQVAEDLLKMVGFVRGTDYDFNKEQKGSETRPDFTVFLPDGSRINVDSKFPYANLQKMTETEDKATRAELQKAFERDIREKIKQVTSRNYINPEDRTVDFVILFIPNEMIFSFIYDKMNSTWTEAMKNKVVLAGPFSFTAILRMVRQAYDSFNYQKNAQKIIMYIKTFEKEFEKYNEEFEKIGGRIDALSKQYSVVNSTRTNQLLKTVDKIHEIEQGDTPALADGVNPLPMDI